MEHASYGSKAEEAVARSLRARGATVKVNTKGPGATDLEAVWPTGTTWFVQVKSSRSKSSGPAWPSSEDLRRLKSRASRLGATPVVAQVHGGEVAFYSARDGRQLNPPDARGR
jgi:Holliday junction resolvase